MHKHTLFKVLFISLFSITILSACNPQTSGETGADLRANETTETTQEDPEAMMLEEEVTSSDDETTTIQTELDNTVIVEEDFSDL